MELIGKIIGAHGVKGDIVLEHQLKGNINLESWDALMIELLPDSRIPFFIEKIKAQTATTFLVKLEEINSPEEVKELSQKSVFSSPNVELKQAVSNTANVDSYIGFVLFDRKEKIGIIDNILNPKTNPLFIINEEQKNELLIPANEELIIEVLSEKKEITMNLPEGLY